MTTTTIPPKIVLPFGKHRGQLITRVPVDYLQWLTTQAITFDQKEWSLLAKEELKRRGTRYDGIMPSHHAIDRFSMRHLDRWDRSCGISAALSDLAGEAWSDGEHERPQDEGGQIVVKVWHKGVGFVFQCGDDRKPHTLKTVL